MKKNAKDFWIKCKSCEKKVAKIDDVLKSIDNQWDPDESTGWVKQRMEAGDLGVMTHKPVYCDCTPKKKIGTVKLVFDNIQDAEITE